MSSELQTGDNRDQVWNYLVHKLLCRLDEQQHDWRSVTSGQFSKLPCIADRYLIDELGRDIEFPRYWYKYGEVGNREPIDSSLYLLEEADWGGLEVRPSKENVEFDISEDIMNEVDESIEFVINNFANVKIEKVKDLQYEHFSPNKFIRIFEDIRSQLYDLAEEMEDESSPDDYSNKKNSLTSKIEELSENYPSDLYVEMEQDFRTWTDVMIAYIDMDDIAEAEAQLEEFWSVFSKVHLRMEHNNNPIEDQYERWRLENEMELNKYRRTLERAVSNTGV